MNKLKIIHKKKFTDEERQRVWEALIVLGVIPLPGDITKEDIQRIRNERQNSNR